MSFEGTLLDDDITADKLAGWLEDASSLHDSRVDEILGELDSFSMPCEEDDEVIPDVVQDYIDSLHAGINKLSDTIRIVIPALAYRAEGFCNDATEAQDALTAFYEEVERDYLERARLDGLYEQLRDIREGYYGNDLSGAIEKLYTQVTNMMEGN